MKTLINDLEYSPRSSMSISLLLLILAILAAGCSSQPTESVTPSVETHLPTLTSLPPSLTQTPTLQLIDSGLVYIVVGIFPEGNLPIYQEPSLSADITGQIPFAGKSIRTTGNEFNADGITWIQIEYQGLGGWVDLSYLAHQEGDAPEELVAQAQTAIAALKRLITGAWRRSSIPIFVYAFLHIPTSGTVTRHFVPIN